MAYGDSAARIRAAKEKLMMRNSPGASEDARIIARQQGAKTSKQVETNAKLIARNRINDAQKNLTRAKMQDANVKLGKRSASAQTSKKETSKTTVKAAAKKNAKTPAKKKVVQMPSKISPSKMTPAQKAQYLKNPERYDG
jgi:hypothetical protein